MTSSTAFRHLPPGAAGRRRRPVFAVLGVLALGLALAPRPAAAQFSVEPAILEFVGADSLQADVITVRNEGSDLLQFRVSIGDYGQSEDGGHVFLEPGESPGSCAGRISVFPEQISLRPGERQQVRVRLAAAEGTCWSLVFIESGSGGPGGIRVGQRIGVKVFGFSPSATREAEIEAVEVAADSVVRVVLDFANLGTAPLRPTGEVQIRTFAGEVVARAGVEPFSVLPGHRRRALVVVPERLPPGQYLAIPILDFGGSYLAGQQAVFRVE